MIDLTQRVNGYTYSHDQVMKLLRYQSGGIRVSYGCDVISRGIKKTAAELVDGEVACDALGEIKLTARLTLRNDPRIDWMNDLLRPYMRIELPAGGALCYPLGVYVPSSPNGAEYIDVECYDRTVYLQEDGIDARLYFPAGTRYTDAIQQILTSAGIPQAIVAPSDAVMRSDREDWEVGTSKLHIVNQLLSEINYRSIETDLKGVVTARRYEEPGARSVTIEYRAGAFSVVMSGAGRELDSYHIPNVFHGVVSNPNYESESGLPEEFSYTYINDSLASKLSTVRRGRRIMAELIRPDNIASQEALEAYVRRVAIGSMTAYDHITFQTAGMPYHGVAEVIGLSLPDAAGVFSETQWRLPLRAGGEMQHTARRTVVIA